MYVTLAPREVGEVQRGVKNRRSGVRVVQKQVGARILQGQGLLACPRNTRPNFRSFRAILA